MSTIPVPPCSASGPSCLRCSLRCLVCVSIAASDRSNAPANVLVSFVREISERHAHRPVRRFKSATVQQHDPVCLGQPEGEIERVDILFQVLDSLIADVLPGPELEIDEAVIAVVVRVRAEFET